jgi:enterochelin esterase family protein
VLYLLHGSGDTPAAWTMAGAANLILDNLIAAKRAVPMIVVMPPGHAVQVYPPVQNPGNNTQLFEDYLLKDVMPWAEARYRVAAGRGNRAIAGLSMGGGQSYAVAFAHLDLFSHLGMFSAAGGSGFEKRFPALAADPKRISAALNALWIGCGRQDRLVDAAREFHASLEKLKVTHAYREVEGGHTWPVWRWCLSEFVPLLFRK